MNSILFAKLFIVIEHVFYSFLFRCKKKTKKKEFIFVCIYYLFYSLHSNETCSYTKGLSGSVFSDYLQYWDNGNRY